MITPDKAAKKEEKEPPADKKKKNPCIGNCSFKPAYKGNLSELVPYQKQEGNLFEFVLYICI